jgi:hypothetical protein
MLTERFEPLHRRQNTNSSPPRGLEAASRPTTHIQWTQTIDRSQPRRPHDLARKATLGARHHRFACLLNYVAVFRQSHTGSEQHMSQLQQREHRVEPRRAQLVVPILCKKDNQGRYHDNDRGLSATCDQAGLEETKSSPAPQVEMVLFADRSRRDRSPCRIAVGGGGQPGM